jgi:hypothetical protein
MPTLHLLQGAALIGRPKLPGGKGNELLLKAASRLGSLWGVVIENSASIVAF